MKKIISLLIPLCVAFAMVTAVSFANTNEPEQVPGEDVTVQMQEDQAGDPAPDAAKGAEEQTENEDAVPAEKGTSDPWVYDGIGWKYRLDTGAYEKGKVLIGGATYFFDRNTCYMKTGLVHDTVDNARYYCDPNGTDPHAVGSKYGSMQSGWKKNLEGSGATYYFLPTSYKAKTGWFTEGSDKYYFNPGNAKMKTGWLKLNGNKYYLSPKNGKMYTSKKTINGATYFFDPTTGKMKTGWVNFSNHRYYFASNGKMKKGWMSLSGNKYYLDPSKGYAWTGRKKVGGSYYYFDTSSGKMAKNKAIKFNGKLHYFFSSGKEVTGKGWFKGSDGKSRYAIGGGAVYTGIQTINGITYKFSTSTGALLATLGDKYDRKIRNMSSSTSNLIYVIKGKHQVRVYRGSKGNWSKIYTFSCELGSSAKPTASGTYKVNGKTAHFNFTRNGKPAHWNNGVNYGSQYGFNGYVWSDKYPDGSIIDSHLGGNSTSYRVRVAESNSVWLYNNIRVGTKVFVQ